jgi:hypothetical protein
MKNYKNTTLSEQFENPTEKWQKQAKSIPLTHKCTTIHFLSLQLQVQERQK